MASKKVLDFKVIHFKFSSEDDPYEIFIKEHTSRNYEDDKPMGRTLFVVNIPPYVDEQNLSKLFAQIGSVVSVKLQRGIPSNDDKLQQEIISNGFRSGYVVYKKRESLVRIMNISTLKPLVDLNNDIEVGFLKYAKQYNNSVYNHDELSERAKRAIEIFDNREKEKLNEEKEQVDDEGWTVVTKKGRNPGLAFKESVENKLNEKQQKKMKKKTLRNFYPFQIKESKREHLANLRQQHEEAKRKIAEMRKNRTFRPY
ncbi:hypothetical protein WA026_014987 [Henosepilachna vigintioctopunctata]|uniref:RRM domain-containing protein n=1 Tax=Henosepilachna vigintioctopunctata TaxID=420089 RepID=A0AAW1UBV7_9CUCU